MKRNFDVKKITRIAILAALSTVLFYIGDIPIIPAFPHLKISLADIPAAVAAVAMGPVAGIIVELIKNLLHVPVTSSFGIGEFISFVTGVALIVPFSLIFKRLYGKYNIILASVVAIAPSAILIMGVGALLNYFMFPLYFQLLKIPTNNTIIMAAVGSSFLLNFLRSVVTLIPIIPFTKRILKYIAK